MSRSKARSGGGSGVRICSQPRVSQRAGLFRRNKTLAMAAARGCEGGCGHSGAHSWHGQSDGDGEAVPGGVAGGSGQWWAEEMGRPVGVLVPFGSGPVGETMT